MPHVFSDGDNTGLMRKVQVDAVLGLSMSPTTVGFVLVEGQDADGATIEHDAFAVTTTVGPMLSANAIAAARGYRLQSIGVTWSDDAGAEAALLLESLNDSGFDNVVPVRLPEATDAWRAVLRRSSGTRSPRCASSNPTRRSC